MKSLLGSVGLALVSLACSGNSDVVFDDSGLTGTSGKGTAATGGTSAGGSEGTSGKPSTGGKGNGGTATNGGMSGSGGSDGGDAGEGPVTMTPDAIFVATNGTDSDDCGLEPDAACKTVSRGVARSVAAQKPSVYVQAGTYAEVVVLAPGIVVVGGFDGDWQSGDRTEESHRVTLKGALHAASQEYVGVWAHDLAESAGLQNLVIVGADAEGQKPSTKNGRSSYAIHAASAKLSLQDVDIVAGKGAPGGAGDPGQDAAQLTATDIMNGGIGTDGSSTTVSCSAETSEGGLGGVNSCQGGPDTTEMNGGKGGLGGARDTSCNGAPMNWNYTAQSGGMGTDAPRVVGQAGKGGGPGSGGGPTSSSASACGPAVAGSGGAVENGGGGKATTGGILEGGFWYALAGGSGSTGKNGGGGGGGGGAGGCDFTFQKTTDARGAGGGGGGAGGCAARAAGTGGGGGGGSFGIFAVGSVLDVKRVSVTRGAGGDAGKGGAGGQGQSGGGGRDGGSAPMGSATPGKGGNGGHGGHAGGGAGGVGGSSYGAVLASGSALNGTLTVSGGTAGFGGDGGVSAPNAAEVESDGNAGERGPDGVVGETLVL